ncbi:hypothetical protein MLD38_006234 [Melastoma candidum]|uniref:Uncharacterized protein n=1 Tax=Melastoma candidum TaxID=119954 RepID=A0ACB9RMS8_9MYRT|nr:hypothetical protein MLD38_006234 [Melastoma candidum]
MPDETIGVQEYVTCREGDMRSLPFPDNYFDEVKSTVFIHMVGMVYGHCTVEADVERMRVVGEPVTVLKARRDRDRVGPNPRLMTIFVG